MDAKDLMTYRSWFDKTLLHVSVRKPFACATQVVLIVLASVMPLSAIGSDKSFVARWGFDSSDSIELETIGGIKRDDAGPRAPEFPDLSKDNTAIHLDGKGARLVLSDLEQQRRFQFRNGDAITMEAWVKLDGKKPSSPMYVIGKGRTGNKGFAKDNQNWSLRVVDEKGVARLSFLFATDSGGAASDWHRWTSVGGFTHTSGWHHIAVSYRFGKPKSIKGWIDGLATAGTWDLQGETTQPPVVDDDEVWIGSSQGGNGGNSFLGWLDAVAVHRKILDDKTMVARFRRVGGRQLVMPLPEAMPVIDDVPEGRVLLTLAESFPSELRWRHAGEDEPKEVMRWIGDDFILPRIPIRHDDWGIRTGWKVPLLVRMVADVKLPPGQQRFMLRTRALSRLWIDGELVVRGEAITKQPPNGEEPVTPVRQPPMPGMRVAGYHQQEVFGEAMINHSGRARVVLEMIVGGKNLRPETGEICVAIQSTDGKSFDVLRNGDQSPLSLTDKAVAPVLASIDKSLSAFDDSNRRQAAATQRGFWKQRHAVASRWVKQNPAPVVPLFAGTKHPIDAFIHRKIDRAVAASAEMDRDQAADFYDNVLPILRENCFRCHGDKAKGGLRLDSREALLDAVTPGNAEQSELLARVRSDNLDERMPPTGEPLASEQINVLAEWIEGGARWPSYPVDENEIALRPVVDDEKFLRRVFLDTVGVPPTEVEAEEFLTNTDPSKRERLVDRLLRDERGADHWVSYWQDMLAENPTLLNQSQGSTGPFRWFLYDSLRDNKPLDRMVTELVLMRGGQHEGGSAGFAMAAENDAPFAAKGHILASAFLGIELQCARCHDSPYHSSTQRDLYSLAAMLQRKPATVPATSQVPVGFFEQRKEDALIQVTLKPGEAVAPKWFFAEDTGVEDGEVIDSLMRDPADSRERLAALITAPENHRFSQVVVNRIWKRLMGAGLVEPVHDWEGKQASHPDLLEWLAKELVANRYDPVHVIRLILTSDVYQRAAIGGNLAASPELRFFSGPERRRLSAEQIVDSLFAATSNEMDVGELTFVHDGRRALSNRQTLGFPKRAWMLADLNNERDRPSLALPKAQAIVDVLEAFGWKGTRQQPITTRESDPNVLQPGVLSNGVLVASLSRASVDSPLADLAVAAESPDEIVETIFLRVLSRLPTDAERNHFVSELAAGFDNRIVASTDVKPIEALDPLPQVTWFNHMRPDANTTQQELERRVAQGPSPDPRLRDEWRLRYEDMVWSLINHREFVWVP